MLHNFCRFIRLDWEHTVKSTDFMGTEFGALTTMDMFMDILICGLHIVLNITRMNKYFIGILNSWIALNVLQIKWFHGSQRQLTCPLMIVKSFTATLLSYQLPSYVVIVILSFVYFK